MVDVTVGKGPSGDLEYMLVFRDRYNDAHITSVLWLKEETMQSLVRDYNKLKQIVKRGTNG